MNSARLTGRVPKNARFVCLVIKSACLICMAFVFVHWQSEHGAKTVLVSTLAGSSPGFANGIGSMALLNSPWGATIDPKGAYALVADSANNLIRHINMTTARVTTLAGSTQGSADGIGSMAQFLLPVSVAIDPTGAYALVADWTNSLIRRIDMATAHVTTLAGSSPGLMNGIGSVAQFNCPFTVAIDPTGAYALVVDAHNYLIRRIDMTNANVTTLAGSGQGTSVDGIGSMARFFNPYGVAIDPTGAYALVAEYPRIRRIDMATAHVTTLAGTFDGSADGIGTSAQFKQLIAVAIDPTGAYALIVDQGSNQRIRRIDLATARVTTLVGSVQGSANGIGSSAQFYNPCSVAIDPAGAYALVADRDNNFIRRIGLATSCAAGFFCPAGSSSATQVACPAGAFHCPAGASAPAAIACSAGYDTFYRKSMLGF
jgi:DNA-binding beta-propeller fold protein YncE